MERSHDELEAMLSPLIPLPQGSIPQTNHKTTSVLYAIKDTLTGKYGYKMTMGQWGWTSDIWQAAKWEGQIDPQAIVDTRYKDVVGLVIEEVTGFQKS